MVLPYVEPGYVAHDNLDGNITGNVVITGTINHNQLGAQTLEYNVTDSQGNVAVTRIRTITVIDTTIPVINLIGDSVMNILKGVTFVDPGTTVTDNRDTDLTAVRAGSVDVFTEGTYTLTYNVSDRLGNVAITVTRTVHVLNIYEFNVVNSGYTNSQLEVMKTNDLTLNTTVDLTSFDIGSGLESDVVSKRHSVTRLIFNLSVNQNASTFGSTPGDLGITNITSKTATTVVRPGRIITVASIVNDDNSWYAPIENNESVTIIPRLGASFIIIRENNRYYVYLTNGGVLFVSGLNQPNGVTYNIVTNTGYFVDGDQVIINGEDFTFGGLGSNGSGGGAGGDPYVYTLDKQLYKLDNISGYCRMLQGIVNDKEIIINVEMLEIHKKLRMI